MKNNPGKRPLKRVRNWRTRVEGGVVRNINSQLGTPAALPPQGGADITPVKFGNIGDAPPGTTVTDLGGPKIGPALNLIFWGSGWIGASNPSQATVVNDIASIISGPYLTSLRQYGVLGARLWRVLQITSSNPPNPFTTKNTTDLVLQMIDDGTLPEPDEESFQQIHCVMMPPGVVFQNPPGSSITGFHTYATWNDYDLGDVDTDQRARMMWVQYGTRAAVSALFSHELVEACTDPEGNGIQVNPSNPSNWNEIADVCASTALVNGVAVQSYWSQKDQSCVIPTNVPVQRQITCIRKPNRHDIWHPLAAVGGVVVATGQPFQMTQKECIAEIDGGNQFIVIGADGSRDGVGVFLHYPPGHPEGTRYIATVGDRSLQDNLLSLPECP